MTRLALFVPTLRGGGAERVMLNLARGFAERGLKVDLLLVRREGPYLSEVPPTVNVVDLQSRRILASLPGLVKYLRRVEPTALLSTLSGANVVAAWARFLAGVSTRLVLREANTVSLATANRTNLRDYLLPALMRRTYRSADRIVAISQGVAEDMVWSLGLSQDRLEVICNPVIAPGHLSKAGEEVDHPWFGLGEPPVLLSAGRLTAQKDFGTLIRAFSMVRKTELARLVILGDGEERRRLAALARELCVEEDVAFLGFVENPYKYMARAAVFVLSSRWEGFGNVLVEALAVGTPVVATDCPSGPAEILGGGRWGTLVPPRSPEALASALEHSLESGRGDEAERTRRVARAREFSLEAALDGYAAVLFGDG